jgi:hypothetical protein
VNADSTDSVKYVRPGWTGAPLRYSDGREDAEWSQCPSCLGNHAASNLSCNGKREPCDRQCAASIGEVQCHRPANHIGPHQARSLVLRIEWEALP